MKMPRFVFVFTCAFVVFTANAATARSQAPPALPNFDITVQLILGSDNGTGSLTGPISSVESRLRENFGFRNYSLAATYFGRAGNHGDLDFKSVADIGAAAEPSVPSFLEWKMHRITELEPGDPRPAVQIESFRMGARIPLSVGPVSAEGGRPAVAYEAVGLNLSRMVLPLNTPTLVGTLTLPGTVGTGFVVLTVRPAVR